MDRQFNQHISDRNRDQILMLTKKGLSLREIRELLSVSETSVKRLLQTYDIVKRGDKNELKAFRKTSAYLKVNENWARQTLGITNIEEIEEKETTPHSMDIAERLDHLEELLKTHLESIDAGIMKILECWGVKDKENG